MADDTDLLAETAQRLFSRESTPSVVRSAEQGTWPSTLWTKVADAGFPWLSIAPEVGGSGGGLADACNVVRIAASFAAPLPLAETSLLGAWILAECGLPLSDGPITVAAETAGRVELQRTGRGWSLTGQLRGLPWGRFSDRVVLLVDVGGREAVAVLDPSKSEMILGSNVAGEPRDDMRLSVEFSDSELVPAPIGVNRTNVKLRGALARSAQIVGALETIYAMTLDYAHQRQQFGKPLASFSAVQDLLVDMAEELAMTQVAVDVAAKRAERGLSLLDIGSARIVADRAAARVTARAHQVHGAIGVTAEHDLQLFTRRVWAWRSEFGRGSEWARAIGVEVTASSAPLWELISNDV